MRRSATLGHILGASRDRLDDVVVAGATANIAVELIANGVFVEIVAAAAHDIERQLFERTSLKPVDINDESVALLIKELRTYPII